MGQAVRKILLAIALTVAVIASGTLQAGAQEMSRHKVDSIRALLPYMPDDTAKLRVLYTVARHHPSMDTIGKYSIATYALAKRLGLRNEIASACIVVGWYYNAVGKYNLAPKYYREAGEIYKERGEKAFYALMISCVGDSYIGLGKFEEGINHKINALKLLDPQKDLSASAQIYRTIGQACMKFQQFKPAMDFLDKALENDMATGDIRGMGRDYFNLGQTINLYSANNESGSKQLAKEYLLHGLQLQCQVDDILFQINTCVHLALIYNDILITTSNWDYADSSLYYYKTGKQLIEQNGYTRLDHLYDIALAERTLLSGNYVAAMKNLQSKIDDPSFPTQDLPLLYQAFRFYYYYNNDYKGILELTKRSETERKKNYITEFVLEISKFNKIKELEEQLRSMESGSERRNRLFDNIQQQFANAKIVIITILVLAIALITIFLVLMNRNLKYSKRIKEQTEELKAANEELGILMEESQQQSELISQQTQELKRQRNRLASINLRIVINLDIASRFQASLMPSMEKMNSIFRNIFVLWQPLEEVSGDFYWGTEAGGLKYVAIADCTGHGIPGASLSMLGISFLNSIVSRIDRNNANAAEVLTQLRYRISESLTRGSTDNEAIHDGMDIAVCIFDTHKSLLSYAGAYRPLWIVNGGQLTEYKGDKTPVAVDLDRNEPFTNNEIHIQEGDKIYIFSDGITDQFGEREKGKLSKLKPKRLRELLCRIYDLPPDMQKAEILSMLDNWRGNNEQTDDIMMVGITDV